MEILAVTKVFLWLKSLAYTRACVFGRLHEYDSKDADRCAPQAITGVSEKVENSLYHVHVCTGSRRLSRQRESRQSAGLVTFSEG